MKHNKISALLIAAFAVALSPILSVPVDAVTTNTSQRLIVTFDKDVSSKTTAMVKDAGATPLKKLHLVDGLVVTVPNDAVAKALSRLAGVNRVEVDARAYVSAPPSCDPWPSCKNETVTTTPPTQPDQTLPWGVNDVDAEKSWAVSRGLDVKVAVIDTGVDKDHPDLVDNIAGGVNVIATGKGYRKTVDPTAWNDDNGHGTHVSGTIAASDNTIGVVGVAPQTDLYGVKVLDANGSGYISDIISGIEWSVSNNMDVINMSLGSGSDVQALHDAVDAAYNAGIVVVAAAGNSGDGNGATNEVGYPAKYDSVIAVGAVDSNNQVAPFSSDGAEVEVAAPGVDIFSTTMGGGYGTMSGTSMASPHTAGVVAAMLATSITASADSDGDGQWSAGEARAVLQSTADDLGVANRDVFYGYGLVDAEEAVTGIQTQ